MTSMSPPVSPVPNYDAYGQRTQPQPRAVSSMSRASTSSHRSRSSGTKLDLTESAKDKRRLATKADPSMAITEAQPSAVALEDSNLDDLRKMQHKDPEGNIITDPDRSNPTRPRMERPLDTIRQFNAAAEGTSRSRTSSYNRPMSQYGSEVGGQRRGSYYNQGFSPSPQRPRYPNGNGSGYYRNSTYGMPHNPLEENPNEIPYQPQPPRMRNPSNPYNQHQNGYPGNGYYNQQMDSPISAHSQQHSYETMTSGSDENSKSTNPSSLNSSFDHLHQMQMRKQENQLHDQYSNDISFAPLSAPHQQLHNHFNNNAHAANGNVQVRDYDPYGGNVNGNGYGGPPRPPAKDNYGAGVGAMASGSGYGGSPGYQPNNPRVPIKLDAPPGEEVPKVEEKRKSWIKRTFSRKN